MNLHGIAGPIIAAVNPMTAVSVRISTGPSAPGPSGKQTPTFATPGAFTASILDGLMTVTAQTAGRLMVGQSVSGTGVAAGTEIAALGTGSGGLGTYLLNKPTTLTSRAMTSSLVLQAQIQPVTWRDIQQMEGLNLQGTRIKAYFYGRIDALVRPQDKGGDLVTVPGGAHAGVYLVAQVLEQFPDWCCCALTLQNESP